MKTINEVHRNETQIDSKIELVDDGSENEIKFPAMLQLQRQKVVAMSEQRHSIPHQTNCKNKGESELDCYDNKIGKPNWHRILTKEITQ